MAWIPPLDKPLYPQLGLEIASINFCESDYAFTNLVAEPANALSSVPLLMLGLYGLLRLNHLHTCDAKGLSDGPVRWLRYMLGGMYVALAMIGCGSTMLHATLLAIAQAADEAPMLMMNLFMLATLFTLSEPDPASTRPWLFNVLTVSAVMVFAFYMAFQHVYVVFLATYGGSVAVIVLYSATLALKPRDAASAERVRREVVRPLFLWAIAFYIVCGFTAWVMDMVFCEAASRLLGPMFLHPIWHTGAMVGTFLAIQCIAASKALALNRTAAVRWDAGLIPYARIGGDLRE